MRIIDVHAHAFPDTLAERAIMSLAENSGDYQPTTDGTVIGLLSSMDKAGVETAWIANIATKPAQAKAILDWSLTIRSPRIVPLGSVHPKSPAFEEEIAAFASAGFPGIKLHPLYQDFFVDDLALEPFFSAIELSGMFVLMHSGYDIAFPGAQNASPKRLRNLIERHPDMDVIMAHLGGWDDWTSVLSDLAGSHCYFDASFLSEVEPGVRDSIFVKHGFDRILFGTDVPWQDQEEAVDFVMSLGLSDGDLEKILYKNAERLVASRRRT